MKKICVVTGARSEFGILKLLIEKIERSNKLKLLLVVTGMHLLEKYGRTIDTIKNEGLPITEVVQMYDEDYNEKDALGIAVGKGIDGLTKCFNRLNPDLLVILGDRYEALAAVVAASTLLIPIAHIHGGDNVHFGQTDEQIRHAITKFSHIHFPATEKSGERIKLLGEERWRIHMVGSPSIDVIYKETLLNKKEICDKFGLDISKKILLCVQHPYIFESDRAGEQMDTTLRVINDLGHQCVITYPNNDPGSQEIINQIQKRKNNPSFKIFKNLERIDYLSLLKNADLLVGNSSSGLIESPIFNLPVINIGNRNKGRETGENVINVKSEYNEIVEAIKRALTNEFKAICIKTVNPYGDGKASERILNIIEKLDLNKEILIKKLTYDIN